MRILSFAFSVGLAFFACMFSVSAVQGQASTTEQVYDFKTVDEMPSFPGGHEAMVQYVITEMKYPEDCQKNRTQAIVKVGFTVSTEGKISGTEILSEKEVDNRMLREAMRVVANMPTWEPAQVKGQKVACNMMVPVVFKLEN